jgi:hypothetical protein
VAKIRHKKKTLNYESKQNIAPKKKLWYGIGHLSKSNWQSTCGQLSILAKWTRQTGNINLAKHRNSNCQLGKIRRISKRLIFNDTLTVAMRGIASNCRRPKKTKS